MKRMEVLQNKGARYNEYATTKRVSLLDQIEKLSGKRENSSS